MGTENRQHHARAHRPAWRARRAGVSDVGRRTERSVSRRSAVEHDGGMGRRAAASAKESPSRCISRIPSGKLPADIVLGKIDAVEFTRRGEGGFRPSATRLVSLPELRLPRHVSWRHRQDVRDDAPRIGNRTYAYLGKEKNSLSRTGPKAVRRVAPSPPPDLC